MGNEADHYTKKGFRPLDFSFADYLVEADVYNSWIKKALLEGSPPILTQSEFPILSGPSFAYPWLVPHLAEYAAHTAGTIQDLAIHRYINSYLDTKTPLALN